MELKLENNLAHQTMPVDGVAAIVEASIQEPAKEPPEPTIEATARW